MKTTGDQVEEDLHANFEPRLLLLIELLPANISVVVIEFSSHISSFSVFIPVASPISVLLCKCTAAIAICISEPYETINRFPFLNTEARLPTASVVLDSHLW